MSLLRELNNEELDQYAQLAADQMRRENRLVWLQGGLVVLAVATLGWAIYSTVQFGFDRLRALVVGLSGLMVYWPYRKEKLRRVWRHHIAATRDEQARRALIDSGQYKGSSQAS